MTDEFLKVKFLNTLLNSMSLNKYNDFGFCKNLKCIATIFYFHTLQPKSTPKGSGQFIYESLIHYVGI